MTDWLMKKDEFGLQRDSDAFIDKSILNVLGMLSGIRWAGKPENGIIYRLNATIKFIFTFMFIIFLSLSFSIQFVLLSDAYILLALGMLELEDIKRTAFVILTSGLFSALILLPSAIAGNFSNCAILFLKITGSLTAVNILANSTKWSHITHSMKVIKLPDVFILVFDITIKYIFILGEFSINMLYALRLRSVGKNDKKHQSLSNLMGGLFLKSKEMAELTYYAMECRGFNGSYLPPWKFRLKTGDFIFIGLDCLLISTFFFI